MWSETGEVKQRSLTEPVLASLYRVKTTNQKGDVQ
jgi:hypothetical protein